MKIIAWNCKMAFRKKFLEMMKYNPDVLVIPECESLQKLEVVKDELAYSDAIWIGNNDNKGIGIFSFNGIQLELDQNHNTDLRYIVPVVVSYKDEVLYNLLALWAQKSKKNYTEYTQYAIEYYAGFIKENSILIGDFNSNKIWDKNSSIGNHSKTVEMLDIQNITSSYHHYTSEEFGEESQPTFYQYHHADKKYHIDYCFVTDNILKRLSSVEIGNYEQWHKLSDHVPIIIELESMS